MYVCVYVASICAQRRVVVRVILGRARALRANAERKINIKFTSRLCIHVDREPRKISDATPGSLMPHSITIASERDWVRSMGVFECFKLRVVT